MYGKWMQLMKNKSNAKHIFITCTFFFFKAKSVFLFLLMNSRRNIWNPVNRDSGVSPELWKRNSIWRPTVTHTHTLEVMLSFSWGSCCYRTLSWNDLSFCGTYENHTGTVRWCKQQHMRHTVCFSTFDPVSGTWSCSVACSDDVSSVCVCDVVRLWLIVRVWK